MRMQRANGPVVFINGRTVGPKNTLSFIEGGAVQLTSSTGKRILGEGHALNLVG